MVTLSDDDAVRVRPLPVTAAVFVPDQVPEESANRWLVPLLVMPTVSVAPRTICKSKPVALKLAGVQRSSSSSNCGRHRLACFMVRRKGFRRRDANDVGSMKVISSLVVDFVGSAPAPAVRCD